MCFRVSPSYVSINSLMVMPSSNPAKTVATGIRVPRNTHAPLTFPGTLSTAGHCDQSSAAIVNQDRKSTRLNSSHSQISYAVFCLKKKKTYAHKSRYDSNTHQLLTRLASTFDLPLTASSHSVVEYLSYIRAGDSIAQTFATYDRYL